MARINVKDYKMWEDVSWVAAFRAGPLAEHLGISRRQLNRYVRTAYGLPPQEWLFHAAMARAPEVLLKLRRVKDTAFRLGFKSVAHFCRRFKERHGYSPKAYIVESDRREQFPNFPRPSHHYSPNATADPLPLTPFPLRAASVPDNKWPREASNSNCRRSATVRISSQ